MGKGPSHGSTGVTVTSAHTHPIQERILARGEYSLAFPPKRTSEGPQGHSLESPKEDKSMERSFPWKIPGCISSMAYSFLNAFYSVTSHRKVTAKCKAISPFLKKTTLFLDPVGSPPSTSSPMSAPGARGQSLFIGVGTGHVLGGQRRVEDWASRFSFHRAAGVSLQMT